MHEVSGPINYCDGSEEYLTDIFKDHARDWGNNPGYAETFIKDWKGSPAVPDRLLKLRRSKKL